MATNEFGEDKWTAEERAVDQLLVNEFQAYEAHYAATEEPPSAEQVAEFRKACGTLSSEKRRDYWASELARLGVAGSAPAPEPAPEISAEPEQEYAPPRRKGRHGGGTSED